MEREIIRGNKALADRLGVSKGTVQKWRNSGLLAQATVSDYGKFILYDLDRVMARLNIRPVRRGRRAAI